jgi:NAD(P)-dependent dehydrogenase (short-subunit alcohol dehydrogenase family)
VDTGLDGRVALVTGGGRGIGAAAARALAGEGAHVAVTWHERDDLAAKVVAEIEGAHGPGRAVAVPYTLGAGGSAEAMLAAVDARLGPVDVLVANAYHRTGRREPGTDFEDVPVANWRAALVDNLTGTVHLCQLVMRGMRARSWGRIVLVSSHVAGHGMRGQETYAAVKAGLHGFARSLAWEAGPAGVLVNAVAPGLTLTDGVREQLPPAVRDRQLALTATGRLSDPQDVAAAVVFLGSAANANVTGQVLEVSGGR